MASLLTEHQQRGILPGDPANYGALQVAFSPDGKRLAVAYGDGYVRMWDPVTGQAAGSPLAADTDPNANGGVYGVAFSRTAICWLPPARPGMCRCGIWPPGGPSAGPSRPVPARGGACPAWRSARTAGSWPPPTRTAPCGCGKCRFSPIRTPHSAPMLDRQQRQIGRITPRAKRSPACADDTCAASGQSRSERGPGRFPDRFILEQDGSHPHVVHGSRTAGRNRAKDVIVQIIRLGAGWQSN